MFVSCVVSGHRLRCAAQKNLRWILNRKSPDRSSEDRPRRCTISITYSFLPGTAAPPGSLSAAVSGVGMLADGASCRHQQKQSFQVPLKLLLDERDRLEGRQLHRKNANKQEPIE